MKTPSQGIAAAKLTNGAKGLGTSRGIVDTYTLHVMFVCMSNDMYEHRVYRC